MAAVEPLRVWLLDAAHVHSKIIDKTLKALEEAEVFEVNDLAVLRDGAGLTSVLAGVTADKIARALGDRGSKKSGAEPERTLARRDGGNGTNDGTSNSTSNGTAETDASISAAHPMHSTYVQEAMKLLSPKQRARCKGKHVGHHSRIAELGSSSSSWNATWAWNRSASWWFMVLSPPLNPDDAKSKLYMELTKVAVLSARAFAGASLYPHLVYLSDAPDAYTSWMEARGVQVHLHNLSFWNKLPHASQSGRLPSGLTFGTYGKLDLPAVVSDLRQHSSLPVPEQVLYTDADVLFTAPIPPLLLDSSHRLFAPPDQFAPAINSGVLAVNTTYFASVWPTILHHAVSRHWKIGTDEQGLLNKFFSYKYYSRIPPNMHARAVLDCHETPVAKAPKHTRCLYVPLALRPNASGVSSNVGANVPLDNAELQLEASRIAGVAAWPSGEPFASKRLKYNFLGYGHYLDRRPPPACQDVALWHYHGCKPWHARCWFEKLAAGVDERNLDDACGCYPLVGKPSANHTSKRHSYHVCDECFLVKYAQLLAWHDYFVQFI